MLPIRIGVVGLGRMGFTHAQNIHTQIASAQLIALCSIDDQAAYWAKTWNIPYHYQDYAMMLANPEIDAVVIVSPTPDHPRQIKQALLAGKHVFCEKPLGTDLAECYDLVNFALKQTNQVVQIGFMRRYDREFAAAKQLLETGEIGRPILIRLFSQDPEVDIANMFRFGPSSGGQFVDVSAHDIDLMIWYLQAYPQRVFSLGKAYKYPEFATWNDGDVVAGMIEFDNQQIGILMASRISSNGYQAQGEIIGTNGHLTISLPSNAASQINYINANGHQQQTYRNFNERFATAYVAELQAFVNRIHQQDYDNRALVDALVNIETALACQQAFVTRQIVDVNLNAAKNLLAIASKKSVP
ncbi:myo-inositol 2-dehydrogenase/D-chiro-inositol 1-dehydrogenase [Mycoplasmoides fastidiosum]|uniref:Myo-inositol 2-dehydrogenase/D-chiro-inositol 1-dehydrogenase n=1 Tax=Mycoplasmoides fastidiosum TaxID=92758 RepID=A0ABU0LZI0_9BACT|nr:Gfo/Idh/MocA family oxidoreductase [Mycoplasmoides fastidiosum]MDQ0514118.1 myo-inositol 2-dehydrogenase/D-chiro-inositol 1-dehydrogenase [Mycoplasmoides fastidiosum]UUD37474.1 Gfo/Idh/MocA family oxidoreductase [Mycoplasmoides fastidiosum]